MPNSASWREFLRMLFRARNTPQKMQLLFRALENLIFSRSMGDAVQRGRYAFNL
jgi:hypothetical protein